MKCLPIEAIKNLCMTRRQLLAMGVLGAAGWLLSPLLGNAAVPKDDLDIVSRMPQRVGRNSPLLVFRDFAADADGEITQYIRRQLVHKKDLYALLKEKIDFDKRVELSIEEVRVRLMYVPQLHEGAGAAYQRYCRNVLDFLFEMIGADNFYTAITSPNDSYPPLADDGISAFLVHRLAKDYQAICRFTAESGRHVKFRTSGSIFSNHLGAVDLEIDFVTASQIRLKRKPFTIWQNSSGDLYTLVALPVEETLHYYVGGATDRQLAECIRQTPPLTVADARQVAEEWIAVEEAIVGGLVNHVVQEYCARQRMALPHTVIEAMRSAEPTLHQYRYRHAGIRWVQAIGFREALARYMRNPADFRDLVIAHPDTWSAAHRPKGAVQTTN